MKISGSREQAFSYIRGFAFDIIERAKDYEWTLQNLGMMRAKIPFPGLGQRDIRIQVWHDDVVDPLASTIHNHPWHFRSHVLNGAIYNTLYQLAQVTPPLGLATHARQEILCGPKRTSERNDQLKTGTPETCILQKFREDELRAGTMYELTAEEIHETRSLMNGTVTLMDRVVANVPVHVYYRPALGFHDADRRKATPEEVEYYAREALNNWVD